MGGWAGRADGRVAAGEWADRAGRSCSINQKLHTLPCAGLGQRIRPLAIAGLGQSADAWRPRSGRMGIHPCSPNYLVLWPSRIGVATPTRDVALHSRASPCPRCGRRQPPAAAGRRVQRSSTGRYYIYIYYVYIYIYT